MITFSKLGNFGRLGNALFEIGAAISLALDNNDTYIFPHWQYENDLNLNGCFSTNIKINAIHKESSFIYQSIPYHIQKNQVLDLEGYFQSWKYLNNNKSALLSLLSPRKMHPIKWGTTSIHIRRGDYVTLTDCYEQLGMNYYNQAIQLTGTDKYLIFSDDINWCKQQFKGYQFEFAEGNDVITDLNLMLSCENNIIANSSFSWWAAYLNKNPSKKVIAPIKWFGPKLPYDTKDLLPDNWIKIM